jgi:hypothetical protein
MSLEAVVTMCSVGCRRRKRGKGFFKYAGPQSDGYRVQFLEKIDNFYSNISYVAARQELNRGLRRAVPHRPC